LASNCLIAFNVVVFTFGAVTLAFDGVVLVLEVFALAFDGVVLTLEVLALVFDGVVLTLEVLALVFDGVVLTLEVLALVFDGVVLALEVLALAFDIFATVFLAFSGDFPTVAFFSGLCVRNGLAPAFFAVPLFSVVFAPTFFVADFVAIKTRLPEKSNIQSHLIVRYDHLV
jgi:hypothetical protein